MSEATDSLVAAVVRTPEGARKYGQPIGSVIKRDVLPSVKAHLPSAVTVPAPHKGHVPTEADIRKAEARHPIPDPDLEDSSAYLDAAGYNERPTVLSTRDFDRFKGKSVGNYYGGFKTLDTFWRGTTRSREGIDPYQNLTDAPPEKFIAGHGIYSNGTHLGNKSIAKSFAGMSPSVETTSERFKNGSAMVRMKIHPDAQVARWSDIPNAAMTSPGDIVRWAVSHGVDVLDLSGTRDDYAGVAVLNRSVLIVEEIRGSIPTPPQPLPPGAQVEWSSGGQSARGEVLEMLNEYTALVLTSWGDRRRMDVGDLTQVLEGSDADGRRVKGTSSSTESIPDLPPGGPGDTGLGASAVGLPAAGRGGVPEVLGSTHRTLIADGQSWRWQLRDRDGQWIRMGSRVRWLSKGAWRTGTIEGSPSPGVATVRDDQLGSQVTLPGSQMSVLDLSSSPEPGAPSVPTSTFPEIPQPPGAKASWPVRKATADLVVGDVIKWRWAVEVTDIRREGDDPVMFGVYRDGPLMGRSTMIHFNPASDIQMATDTGRDVTWEGSLQQAREKLDVLQKKYPEGLAVALDRALVPPRGAAPKISPALSKRLQSKHWTDWNNKRAEINNQLLKLPRDWTTGQVAQKYQHEENVLDAQLRDLDPEVVGGPVWTTQQMLNKHQDEYQKWLNRPRYLPTSPEAQKILAEIQDVGDTVRLGIDFEVARKIPDSSAARFMGSAVDPDLVKRVQAERRRLATKAVETLVGTGPVNLTWGDVQANEVIDVALGEYIRPLSTDEKTALTESLQAYPESWSRRFSTHGTGLVTRGFYRRTQKQLMVSDHTGEGVADPGSDMRRVMTHEIGHGMEVTIPGLAQVETTFWAQRMGETSPLKVHDEDGAWFPDDIPGNVAHPTPSRYTLKTYAMPPFSDTPKQWEVFTTGVQDVLTGRTDMTYGGGGDTGLWDMAMGAMLTLNGK